jgi:hypothetical protein
MKIVIKSENVLGWSTVTSLHLMMIIVGLSFKIMYALYDFIFYAVLTAYVKWKN